MRTDRSASGGPRESAPEDTRPDRLLSADPSIERFVNRNPEVRAAVAQVLERAEDVRSARAESSTPDGYPQPAFGAEHERASTRLREAVERLETAAEDQGATTEVLEDRARDVAAALAALRAESHAFAEQRAPSTPQERSRLIQALRGFARAYQTFDAAAQSQNLRRIPWQLELSSHVAPGASVRDLTITGYDLPGVPSLRRSWGERCCLTGRQFLTDSHVDGEVRHRSLDSYLSTLSTTAYELVARIRAALDRTRGQAPEASALVARAFPFVFDEYVAETSHPTFSRLGLDDLPSLPVSLNNALLAFADRPLLGARSETGDRPSLGVADRVAVARDGAVSGYRWLSFDETRRRALALAHRLEQLELSPDARVGILMDQNRPEFYLADFAIVFTQRVSVGLQFGLADEVLAAAADQVEMEAIVVDGPGLQRVLDPTFLDGCPSLRHVVSLGAKAPPASAPEQVRPIDARSALDDDTAPAGWRSASGIGLDTPILYGDPVGYRMAADSGIALDDDERLYTVAFTSGTTATPKGIPITRRRWIEDMVAETNAWPYVVASLQPSAYIADRAQTWSALLNGGRAGFARKGESLFQDIRAIRPTVLDVPPVIWNSVYTEYKHEVADPTLSRSRAAAIRKRYRESLGGRLAMLGTGGAPSDPGVRRTIEEIFGVPMNEGYGASEIGNIARNGKVRAGVEVRLVDCPELGYTKADKPFPRGELAVKTPNTITSYYNDPNTTADAFTEDGFFRTGDLAELRPGNEIRILGRSTETFKLAGAEFVQPELLERHYQASELVETLFVTGSSLRSQVAAVVVPTRTGVTAAEVLNDLRSIARREGLRACEIPIGVVVEPRRENGDPPWSAANGLLTPSLKLNRRALARHYAGAVDEVYGASSRGGALDLDSAAPDDPSDGTLERLRRVVAAVLQLEIDAVDTDSSFQELGGDSLGSMELMLRIDHVFGGKGRSGWNGDAEEAVRVPLRELATQLDASTAAPRTDPAPADLGAEPAANDAVEAPAVQEETTSPELGDEAAKLRSAFSFAEPQSGTTQPGTTLSSRLAEDAESFLRPTELPALTPSGDVLLTGGTGFLGSHLLSELAGSRPGPARVYALVRAADHGAARERLRSKLAEVGLPGPRVDVPGEEARASGDGESTTVIAIAGHLERHQLGLDHQLWEQLCQGVGPIYHVAAQLSEFAGYEELRASNVVATRNLLELATTTTLKPFHFVSSLNVAQLLGKAGHHAGEQSPLGERLPPKVADGSGGYVLTKWVGERMVRGLAEHCGRAWPAVISRPAMITWSAQTGFANASDWLTRILSSCLQMDAVPTAIEVGRPQWLPVTASSARGIDMVPVDFVARALIALTDHVLGPGDRASDDASTSNDPAPVYHVSNRNPGVGGFATMAALLDLLVGAVATRRAPPAALPLDQWLLQVEIERAPVLPLVEKLAAAIPAYEPTRATDFAAAVPDVAASCPVIDRTLVERFVDLQARS